MLDAARLKPLNWEIEPHESIEERIANDSYDSLTDAERAYHSLWRLFFVAYGPGLLVYFDEIERSEIEVVLNGLAMIQATKMQSALQDALNALPPDYFECSVRLRNNSLPETVADTIHQITSRFIDCTYPKEELERFIESNDVQFLGPRTKLELWKSMTQRGADTSPRFTAKAFDRLAEAEKDRPYSTRSCPNCDYPSPDYRPSCKACGYPHGRG